MEATIKTNVLATCSEHGLPIEFAVYFLTMIDMAGGDYNIDAAHPDKFTATVERISRELSVPNACRCYLSELAPLEPMSETSKTFQEN